MDEIVRSIVNMGFDADQVQEALQSCDGNQERAIDMLLSKGSVGDDPPNSLSLVESDVSQYSFEMGRSACTCISLMGARLYLEQGSCEITANLLKDMILKGIGSYQSISRSRDVEHMSAEEVLSMGSPDFPLEVSGGVRQGILSADSSHPLGLKSLLESCKNELNAKVVLLTKTPETVLVCLDSYIIIDSHPRHFLNVSHAYAKFHDSLDFLVKTLELVFPHTALGADVPEMMAMMYNSFDLYPLKRKNS
mmetsp:Transcript_11805/g.18129  ORF Transcript_11805/g.18129 Transcript_11805/m.18129 type:complete len:250 (-) Transcript_11805:165-914(-)